MKRINVYFDYVGSQQYNSISNNKIKIIIIIMINWLTKNNSRRKEYSEVEESKYIIRK